MDVVWDGITRSEDLNEEWARFHQQLADASPDGDWASVFELLAKHPECVNSCRPGGASLYAPLHQAAHTGAPIEVVNRLLQIGGWRTLQNARGERAVDVAIRQNHSRLTKVLNPEMKHSVPIGVLQRIQREFHIVIRGRIDEPLPNLALRLPELEPLLELDRPKMWFPVPGMYGGFSYWLECPGVEAKLISESWCRIEGGSGQRHEITSAGHRLVDEGFV